MLVSLVSINPRINGWNEASRMALTQSLVEQHSFQIDESVFVGGGDKVFINSHYYSDKPPMPSLLAAVVYAPLYHSGLTLDFGWSLSYYLIILLTIKLFWIFSVLAFRRALKFTSAKEADIPLLLLVYAFASLAFSWSTTFNNHSLAGSSLMIAFMFYLSAREKGKPFAALCSGLFFGLAATMDMPTGIFLLGFGSLVLMKWKIHKLSGMFWLGALCPLLVHFSINFSIGGTLLPLQIIPEYFIFEGSTWENSASLSGVKANSLLPTLKYAILSLVGPKGFLLYNPLFPVLVVLLVRTLRAGHFLKNESLVILIGSLILMTYYFVFSSNFGGWSYSIRWFIPLLPLLYFYLYDVRTILKLRHMKRVLGLLTIISIGVAMVGIINPWSNPEYHVIPFIANLKQLMGFLS